MRTAILLLSLAFTAPAFGQGKGIYADSFDYFNAKGELVQSGYVINDFALDCGANKKGKFSFSRPAKDTLLFKCTYTLDFIEHPRAKPETVTFTHIFKDKGDRVLLESISSRNGLLMTPQGIEQVVNELGKLNQ